MKSIKLLSLALTMLCCFLSFGQEKLITGTVSDKNEVLPFVVVQIKGTKTYTHTDFDGKFSIKAKVGETLLFSFIGYEPFKVKIKKRTNTLNIVLISNTILLQETYHVERPTQRKLNQTEIIKISKEAIEKT
ncbi:carboxypeptidase-like regulatory domain-containing protein [Flavobacterium sp.]|uniref:carboxypeptidase-like regulatory domain-containing protein n=1 Tax=Flavobacterium sp. TaxID=239 RepID=UPI00260ACFD0|nr:carboxypeptidase-like regulatory domain-containing protein [Flavobacterium sp.]